MAWLRFGKVNAATTPMIPITIKVSASVKANFVSREFVQDIDEPVSYFTIQDESKENIVDFIRDIKYLSRGDKQWNIVLISSDNMYDTQIHLVHKMKKRDSTVSTTPDEETFQAFYASLSETLGANHQLACDLDEKYRPVGQKNIGIKAGGGKDNNTFTMRISYSVTTWMDTFSPVILDMAKTMKQYLEADERKEFSERTEWKVQGIGFGNNVNKE